MICIKFQTHNVAILMYYSVLEVKNLVVVITQIVYVQLIEKNIMKVRIKLSPWYSRKIVFGTSFTNLAQ